MSAATSLRFMPDFRLQLNGAPAPPELRASVVRVAMVSGLDGADRVELTLVNDGLRWLDNPLFALDTAFVLSLGSNRSSSAASSASARTFPPMRRPPSPSSRRMPATA